MARHASGQRRCCCILQHCSLSHWHAPLRGTNNLCIPVSQDLLTRHGVVCITRDGSDVAALLERPGSLLHTHRANVAIVKEPVPNEISSSRVGLGLRL